MRLTTDMQRVITEQRLGFVATVSADGRPNVSPKGTTVVLVVEHIAFVDVASPGTVRNLAINREVEINVVDPLVRKGYRFRGRATVHRSGPDYDRVLAVLRGLGSAIGPERARSVVTVHVAQAAPLVSPAYETGATEAEVAASWFQRLADLHAGRTRASEPDP